MTTAGEGAPRSPLLITAASPRPSSPAQAAPAARTEETPAATAPDKVAIPRELANRLAKGRLFGGPNGRPSELSRDAVALLGLDAETAAEINRTLAAFTKRSLAIQQRHTTVVKNTPEEQVFQTNSFYDDGGSALEAEMRAALSARIGEERIRELLKSFPDSTSEEGSFFGFGTRTITFTPRGEGFNVQTKYQSTIATDSSWSSMSWDTEELPDEFRGLLEEEQPTPAQ